MFAEVAVFSHISKIDQTFSYKVPDQLRNKVQTGQIVLVPLKTRRIEGIILSLTKKKPPYNTKDIIDVIDPLPVIWPYQIKLMEWMSKYYMASFGQILRQIVPPHLKRNVSVKDIFIGRETKKIAPASSEMQKTAQQVANSRSKKLLLKHNLNFNQKLSFYTKLAQEFIKKDKQVVFCFSQFDEDDPLIFALASIFKKDLAVIGSFFSKSLRFAQWDKVRFGKAKVIVGSRMALFAPCPNLGAVVVDDEEARGHKQDQTPKFITRDVAEILSEITGAKVVLASPVPSIEAYYKVKTGRYELIELKEKQREIPEISIVDLDVEYRRKNFGSISEPLQEKIKGTLQNKKQSLLFLDRKGAAHTIICADCGFEVKCPDDNIPLTLDLDKNKLICHHCGFSRSPILTCPECKSHKIKYRGWGIQRTAQEAKELFPSASIAILSKEQTIRKDSLVKVKEQVRKSDIVIATQKILDGFSMPHLTLVGIILGVARSLPDFRGNERSFQLISRIAYFPDKEPAPKDITIQVQNRDSLEIEDPEQKGFNQFYQKELRERKEENLPPYSKLIRLLFTSPEEEECKSETGKIVQSLRQRTDTGQAEISNPYPCFITKEKNKYHWQILIKYKPEYWEAIRKIIRSIKPNKDWTKDIDPDTLL